MKIATAVLRMPIVGNPKIPSVFEIFKNSLCSSHMGGAWIGGKSREERDRKS